MALGVTGWDAGGVLTLAVTEVEAEKGRLEGRLEVVGVDGEEGRLDDRVELAEVDAEEGSLRGLNIFLIEPVDDYVLAL